VLKLALVLAPDEPFPSGGSGFGATDSALSGDNRVGAAASYGGGGESKLGCKRTVVNRYFLRIFFHVCACVRVCVCARDNKRFA
jgi:hypothetical protein